MYFTSGYTLHHIAKQLFCSMGTVHRDVEYLKGKAEEASEGRARLSISLTRSGRIQSAPDQTLIEACRRIERHTNSVKQNGSKQQHKTVFAENLTNGTKYATI